MLFLLTSKIFLAKNLQVVLFWAWKSLPVFLADIQFCIHPRRLTADVISIVFSFETISYLC